MARSLLVIGLLLGAAQARELYSLEDILAKVTQDNLEIQAFSSDVEAGESNMSATRAAHWPTLALTAGLAEHLEDQRLAPAVRNNDPAVYSPRIASAELKARWVAFSGGKLIAATRLSAANLEGTRQRLEQLKDQRKLDAIGLYYRILAEQARGQALDSALGATSVLKDKVKALLAAQKAGRLDSLNVEVRLANLRQERILSQGLLSQWKRNLAVLLARPSANAEFDLAGYLDTNGLQSSASSLDWEVVTSRHPVLLAYQSEEQALRQKVSIARGSILPSVSLQGNYGLRSAVDEPLRTDNGKNPATSGSVGLFLDWNLFAGAGDHFRIKEDLQRLRSLQTRRRQVELALRAELEGILDRVNTARSRVTSLVPVVALAREAWSMELLRYENQRGTHSDALLAESSWLQARTLQAQSIAEWKTALAQWNIATGDL